MENILIGITDCSKYLHYKEWMTEMPGVQVTQLSYQKHEDIERCDGFILTGGTDVHPSFYGSRKTDYAGHPKQFEEERDRFEIEVFHRSREREIPLLAICRG
ncbi:MAG TPA: gamma-glutamyl-gamma-aminobutyrate hydrolase family protein, partial [Puia sp.]|nr:gamma-glutamyl-gamma-aminobutyrate hydrolase family protein [Puia sp.]